MKKRKDRARSAVQEPKKKAGKSRKRGKNRRQFSSSEDSATSSSDTSSSESGESEDEILAKTERFHVVAQEGINKYDLPAELAEYANEYCCEFIPGKEIEKSISCDHQSSITYKGLTNWTVSCEIF